MTARVHRPHLPLTGAAVLAPTARARRPHLPLTGAAVLAPPARARRPHLPLTGAALLALSATTGCTTLGMVQAGFVTSTTMQAGRQGVAAELHLAEEVDEPFHFDFAVRGRVTKEDRQFAMGLGVLLAPKPDPVAPYALAGVHFFQVGTTDDAFSYGFGTPYAEAGVLLRTGDQKDDPSLLLSTSLEYTLHYSPQPHEGFWTTKLGLQWW